MINEENFVNVEAVASFLNQDKKLIYKWAQQDEIPHYKFGRTVRFLMSEVKKWAKERKVA